MARRGQSVTISLFSFQDIITSVSGILIFITLMLVLELIQSVEGDPANRVARDLDSATLQAQRELDSLKDQIRRSADELVQAIEDGSADSLVTRTEMEAAARSVEGEIETIRDRAEDAKAREDRADARKHAVRDDEEQRDLTLTEARHAQEEIERDRREDRVYYTAGDGAGRDRWLVEIGGETIAAAPLGRPQVPTKFPGRGSEDRDAALDRFLSWCRSETPGAYFLILVRPSGHPRLEKVREAFRDANRSFGFDLIGEGKKVLDDETGAGPP